MGGRSIRKRWPRASRPRPWPAFSAVVLAGSRSRHSLLTAGAILGHEFDLDVAGELADIPPGEIGAALDEARLRHLVWLRPNETTCVFVHDKVRESFLDQLDARQNLNSICRPPDHLRKPLPIAVSTWHSTWTPPVVPKKLFRMR